MKKLVCLFICSILIFASMPLGVYASEISKQESTTNYEMAIDKLASLEGKEINISQNERAVINRINIEPVASDKSAGGIVTPQWTYTIDYTTYQVFNSLDAPIPSSKWIEISLGMNDPWGNPYFASGYVYHVGTAYNFPSTGKKQAVYEGTLSCWIY